MSKIPTDINPRYWLWQQATGGTRSHEFMRWIQERWRDWREQNRPSMKPPYCYNETDHRDFDAWLIDRYHSCP